MRVFLTGSTGFVGRWLQRELEDGNHEVIGAPPSSQLSISDTDALRDALDRARPDAIIHLAAVAFAPDASADPSRAINTNVHGTSALLAAAARVATKPVVVVVSSSEVYGSPRPEDLPLSERAQLRPRHLYGLTKLAQEAITFSAAVHAGVPAVIVRPFNHTGPGQRTPFAVPAFIERALAVRRGEVAEFRAGNLDVQRDIGDVRDVARAYRLIVERLAADRPETVAVFNVATGQSVAMRRVVEMVCELGGVEPRVVVDPSLVREDDPSLIVGNADALRSVTGWAPAIPLSTTLAEMVAAAERHSHR